MSRKRAALGLTALALLALALVLVLRPERRASEGARPEKRASEGARPDAKSSARSVERPRRPRVSRPRPAPRETVEASVTSTTPASTRPSAARAEQLATTVLGLAVRNDWVVMDEHDTPCPPQQIRIVFDAPADLGGYRRGAYFEPLGPGPDDSVTEVNGLMLCEGSTYLYRGFEAFYRADRGQWDVFPFPVIE